MKNNNWQTKKLEDCLDKIVYTKKIYRKDFLDIGKLPIISQEKDLINGYWNINNDLFKVKKPVVIFGDHTKVLKYIDFDFVLGADGVKILKPNKDLDSKYFYYALKNINLKDLGYARHYRLLKEKNILFPPLPEQQRIVKILDEVFEKIDKAKANTEKNLQNNKELFESYLRSVIENKGKDWIVCTIENLINEGIIEKIQDGNHGELHPRKSDFVTKGVPFIMAADLKNKQVDLKNCNFITEKQADGLRIGFAKNNDVLLTHKGTIGRTAVLKTDLKYVILTPQITYYRIKNSQKLTNKYLMYYFDNKNFQTELNNFAKDGSTRAYIGITKQLKLSFAYPSLLSQKSIVVKLDALSEKTKKLETIYKQKLADLEELRKSVLKKVFSGEL